MQRAEHLLAKPRSGSKIVRHMIAVTDREDRPRHEHDSPQDRAAAERLVHQQAMPSPMTSSRLTEITVNRNVVLIASQNSAEPRASV